MKKVTARTLGILLYVIFMVLSSCTGPAGYNDVYVSESVEDLPVEQESPIEMESAVIETEEIKMSEKVKEIYLMKMRPIEVFEKYCVTDDMKIVGLSETEMTVIVLSDTEDKTHKAKRFYKDSKGIYFSVSVMEQGEAIPNTDPVQYEAIEREYMFKQVGDVVTEITEFPEIPESGRVVFGEKSESNMSISKEHPANNPECSYVWNGIKPTGYLMVDGFMVVDNGLWWSVPEDYSTRLKGLYFQKLGGNVQRILPSGRIF